MRKALYWKALSKNEILCLLCPRSCSIKEGESGHCVVRKNINNEMVVVSYGRASSVSVDPIEKKPLFHFYPGTSVFSFGTIGCNLSCEFCQNDSITKTQDTEILRINFTAEEVVSQAIRSNSKSIAFTYNDPVPSMEFALDVAEAAKPLGIKTIAISAGYINPKPAREYFNAIDAANIDLKSFNEGFYKKYTDSSLKPVLNTLKYIVKNTKTWLEITTLLIPDFNDSKEEISNLVKWVSDNLGNEVPLHFSAFFPAYHFSNIAPTPASKLIEAREIALKTGIKYVYTGNRRIPEGESTYCPGCKKTVIERDGFNVITNRLNNSNSCPFCGHKIAGVFF